MELFKLGKHPKVTDPRTLQFRKYRLGALKTWGGTAKLPAGSKEVSWVVDADNALKGNWNMFMNDTLGCCVPAAAAHMTMQWSWYANAGKLFVPSDAEVLRVYEDVGGFVPGNPATDNGCDMLTMCNYWRQTGVAGKKILAFLEINPLDFDEIREAIELFGSVYTGLGLPVTAQAQPAWEVSQGGIYTANGAVGSWGGHCVPYMAVSPLTETVISWGAKLKASHNFSVDYADEMYAILSPEWIGTNGLSPSKLALSMLEDDFGALTGDNLKLRA